MERTCPVCGCPIFRPTIPEQRVAREVEFREDFVFARVGYKASPAELKDLTDFMHGFPAPLLECARCGLMVRDEPKPRAADNYEEDPNDPDLMKQVYPRYVEAFRHKARGYEALLAPHSDVLELGSHLGAFLQTAEEWNWRPAALDIGVDTSEFALKQGFDVRREAIEDTRLADGSFDGLFIWNCFEQLTEPAATLERAWRLLRRFGLLVVRVPSALFYRELASQFWHGGRDAFVVRALAYNNLLGFPYLYGYTAEVLQRLIEAHGFKYLRGFNSELVTMPFADITRRIDREQRASSRAVARWSTATTAEHGTLTGPWIEMAFRKLSEPAWRARTERRGNVVELPRRRIDLRFLERAA